MRAARLQSALERRTAASRNVEAELAAMKAEHDPLATHIFLSRRNYRNADDTKGGKRREINARLSFNTACELGFRGSLDEWERLLGAVRSEEHTSELQSQSNLVCRLLLEKKKKTNNTRRL